MFAIKTLVELFDSCQIENVIAGLRYLPEKIVFVGFKEIMTPRRTAALEEFFNGRGIKMNFDYEVVGRYDYESICNKLNDIIDRNEDCCFDLTGGKELVLTAMGEVASARAVPMLQFNVRSGNLIRVKACEKIEDTEKRSMTIPESILINGGLVVSDDKRDFKWDLNRDFRHDIGIMWEICKESCGSWNRQSTVLESFEKFGKVYDDRRICVNLKYARDYDGDIKKLLDERIIESLSEKGLITGFELKNDILSIEYKNEQVRQCITKAGNILELYVYSTAFEITEENPGFYDDIDVGIHVDWDGIIHSNFDKGKDTRNEIDVMMMRDLVPVFVSCKNGEVHKEALYELETVAERFGGEYAKKILVTTYISGDENSKKYITQRAHDMGIHLIKNVEEMSKEEFKNALMLHAK